MTDKQIIIDGIDVSGCRQYMPRYMEDYDIDTLDYCNRYFKPCKDVDVKYCHYKQLKHKEQEYNKLYIQLKADEEYYKEEENTLRKIIKNKEERNMELYKENNKFKRTLTEVKEIAEENIRISELEGLNGVYRRGLAKQVLQKINEVLND